MILIDHYMTSPIRQLRAQFGVRLIYVGLQGSYQRGEATENSDIDVMVVLDQLTVADMDDYRAVLKSVGNFDRSCGFICGVEDLKSWNTLELCHLLHTTEDYVGKLSDLIPRYSSEDVRQFAKLSLNNLYHALCHRYIHKGREKSLARLPEAGRSVFFILQNTHYLETGEFIQTKRMLLSRLSGMDRDILQTMLSLAAGETESTEAVFSQLLCWCQQTLSRLNRQEHYRAWKHMLIE